MPDIGVKNLLQSEIVDGLKQGPCVALLNIVDGDGVYAAERLETRDGYANGITPCILVDMPTQTGTESVGPQTSRATLSTTCYLYFSEQSDRTADELAALIVSAARVSLSTRGRTANMVKIGGYSNCFEVQDIGWGEYGQDKVYAFEVSMKSSVDAASMVTI